MKRDDGRARRLEHGHVAPLSHRGDDRELLSDREEVGLFDEALAGVVPSEHGDMRDV